MTNELTATLKRNGWQVSPNNIHGLAGVELVPAGPGSLQPASWNQSVRFVDGAFVVLERTHQPAGDFLKFEHAAVFSGDEAALVAWLKANGRPSEGGQPANVWD